MSKTLRERFDEKWSENPRTGCWEWTAWITPTGYGQFFDGGRMRRAHRVGFGIYRGPVPQGLDLDHLCSNRKCVNPEHLEPVSRSVNLLRSNAVTDRLRYRRSTYALPPGVSRNTRGFKATLWVRGRGNVHLGTFPTAAAAASAYDLARKSEVERRVCDVPQH